MVSLNTSDDLLRCPISMELFRDPVLAPDGHTYERKAIEIWIQKNGTSPMTRQPLSIEQLYPNRTVKELVDIFETSLRQRNYKFTLDVDVKKKKRRPIFQTFGKTIYAAEWVVDKNKRPEIIILKIDSTRAKKEASFYVDLSRHPHIIRTFGFVYDRQNLEQQYNSILLVQEYAPEGSLYELLQERTIVPDEKILIEMFLQIIEAMICLSSNHVVHGDLACRNVLVFHFDENHPERTIVKITDFGLSRYSQLYSTTPGAAMTVLNIVPIRYAAPEILSSDSVENYTQKSDVYSMGVLMWEAYSGGLMPWTSIDSDNDVIRRVRNGETLSQPSNCSQPFWSIMTKTWSILPNDRPTFSELKHLLAAQYYHSVAVYIIDFSSKNGIERYDMKVECDVNQIVDTETQLLQEERKRKPTEERILLEQLKQKEPPSITQAILAVIACFAVLSIRSLIRTSELQRPEKPEQIKSEWNEIGVTVAGGNGGGNQSNQLYFPSKCLIDRDKSILITDLGNNRIVKWKYDANDGEIMVIRHETGDQIEQLSGPRDIIADKQNNSFIICEQYRKRVLRWQFYQNEVKQEVLIDNISCYGLAMDKDGFLYVSDDQKNEVRKWRKGDNEGIVVAGGNGKGDELNQFDSPTFIFVDENSSIYVSDWKNHRVMKWRKNAQQGIIAAGGNGEGNGLKQLSSPRGVVVDYLHQIYVSDMGNNRIMRWTEGNAEGSVFVGRYGPGKALHQLRQPTGLSMDNQGNLYVADWGNYRIQKFEISRQKIIH
ncbi:unnamed protein product [Adineta ricciae]|uniref:Uncharacterized protein n=1 Tax=Adineta ricciae TaxID=249248 RepID=A0A815TIK6_ADIRI|nr:unnamed protein product [Adineta ricciae]CAF1509078.1 unnamed protein product [Adineta ricciae]